MRMSRTVTGVAATVANVRARGKRAHMQGFKVHGELAQSIEANEGV